MGARPNQTHKEIYIQTDSHIIFNLYGYNNYSHQPRNGIIMRRVVVTGIGAITPLGVGIRQTWNRLIAGDSGIVSVAHLEPQARWRELTSTVAGLVPSDNGGREDGIWRASDWASVSDQRRMSKFTQYAVAASDMALKDAMWKPESEEDLEATGVCLGSGIGNLDEIYETSLMHDRDVTAPPFRSFRINTH